ncbi:DUF418 domain-containing protein [Micromonospora sp. KC207]|uniref:DUF418 domain-containing protein n=1 Tax=Micromonospora sp. KC207 TaxID=2530377 RepID=UPI001050E2E4|nr:DUF418 domain-containing protein [Micromonospora sp. KC207]TDC44909.1 DUF418 domain-containing protein [Micromonospora sp. KC207]
MTSLEPVAHASPPQSTPSPDPGAAGEHGPSTGRLVGVDLTRAFAVFGMFAVHVGPFEAARGDIGGWIRSLSEGRASALFATLAGFSLMLIAGRFEPKTGLAGRQAKARIVIRAVILLVVGTALTMTDFGDAVILNAYAVYFLLALPLTRLRARTLAVIAAVLALVGPQVGFGLRAWLGEPVLNSINAYDPLERLCGVGVLDLLLTGFYPAISWMSFVIAGMALGRLDLAAGAVQRRLAVLGPALIALGYGMSWLALKILGGGIPDRVPDGMPRKDAMADLAAGSAPPPAKWSLEADPWLLLAAEPHSGSTFDVIGCLGVAITVLLCATVAMAKLPRLRRLAGPVIAVGTMSLTIYVGHILAILALPGKSATPPDANSTVLLCAFVLGAVVFAALWSRFFRRGPLEDLLNSATKPARLLR